MAVAAALPRAAQAQAQTEGQAEVRDTARLAAAGPGSAYLAFGQAIAPIVAHRSGIALDLVQTSGSTENARLVGAGQVPFGLLSMMTAADAWHGRGPFAPGRLRGLRAVAPMYEAPFAVLALRQAGIATLRGLGGKRVAVGPVGEPSEIVFNGLRAALGLQATVVTGSPPELAAKLLRGEVDAFWYGAGLPTPPFDEVLKAADAVVFGLRPDEVGAVRTGFPMLAPFSIPALTYRGQDAPLDSLAVWNFVVAHEGTPNAIVGRLASALIEGADEVAQAYPAAVAMRAMNLDANTALPWHPGAAVYYRRDGSTLPEVTPG